jgi:hypothetical protein
MVANGNGRSHLLMAAPPRNQWLNHRLETKFQLPRDGNLSLTYVHMLSRGGRRARWVRKMLHRDVGIWRQQSLVACVRLAPGRPPSYSSGCGTGRARRRSCPLAAPGRSNSTAWLQAPLDSGATFRPPVLADC